MIFWNTMPGVWAASSWNPTQLVNTESFQTVDEGNSTTNIEFRFGQTLNEKLYFDRTFTRFTFTKGIYVNGSITGSGLVIRGNMSGRSLNVDRNATVGGTFAVSGATLIRGATSISGAVMLEGNLTGSTINGFGLPYSGCTDSNKLLWNNATGKFSCSADLTGGGGAVFGSGQVITIGDNRYVRTAGGTMTGNIIVRAAISGTTLRIGAGGTDIHGALTASGNVRTDGDLTLNDDRSAGDTTLTFGNVTANQTLKFINSTQQKFQFSTRLSVLGTVSGSSLNVDRNATVGGTFAVSGVTLIRGATSISGALMLEGNLTGSTINGFGLPYSGCTGSNKLLWNNATGKFSCSADLTGGGGTVFGSGQVITIGDNRYVRTAGGTMTGNLIVRALASGSVVHASSQLRSSGSLIVEGNMSGATIEGANLKDCDTAATSKLLWDVTTKKFSCGTDQTGGGSNPPWAGVLHATMGDGNSIYVARSMEVLNTVAGPTPTGIGTTVARCVGYRSAYAITVNRVRLLGVGATTNLYKFAVYPRGTGAARLWESGTVTSAANTWLSISAATPFSLSANTDYWFCVSAVTTGTTAGFRSMPAPINTIQYNADNSPLGNRSLGLPVFVQFAVTAGAFPATLPAVVAAAYAGGSTGSVPFAFFDNSSA
ncbi:hypothetical protein HZA87_00580 [Candidatus Uhrbacteria bacterium]|nr:hypothetical protein [Candidatus Uhrbacteria bacterium]